MGEINTDIASYTIHNTPVLPTFLYGSENWTLTASQRRRIEAAEMKSLRPLAGYTSCIIFIHRISMHTLMCSIHLSSILFTAYPSTVIICTLFLYTVFICTLYSRSVFLCTLYLCSVFLCTVFLYTFFHSKYFYPQ